METSNENNFGSRLRLARKLAGMSLQDLADALNNKVTKQALNKYEMGQMNPTSEVLLAISKTLKTSTDYFLKRNQIEFGEIQFRKKAGLTKKDEESIIEKARDYVERYLEIEDILAIESKFINPLKDFKITNKNDVEKAAEILKEKWDLGNNPIPNLVEMLELKGIRVLLITDVDQIDGFAAITSKGIPVVVINVKNKSVERIRFTIIHELAHILLQFDDAIKDNSKSLEIHCHFFSTCFLISSKMVIQMIGGSNRTYISINELISIKEYYGISIRAILHRLKEMKIITDNYYQRWVIYLSKTHGQKDEPGKYKGEEKSKFFEQLINRALSEGLISISKAAAISNTNVNELRKQIISVI